MTVQLKNKVVKTAINEIVAAGIESLNANDGPILLNTRGMVIDLDDGTVTLKFKANKNFGDDVPQSGKTPKSSKKAKDEVEEISIKFERGEKADLKADYKSNIEDYKEKGVILKQFGAHIEIKDKAFMVVGFEDGKFTCRNEKGRDVKKPLRAVVNAFEEAQGKKPVKADKPAGKKKPASSGTKQSKSFGASLVELKQGPKEEKFKKAEKTNLERKFGIAAGKMKKDGIVASWFFKVVTVKNKRLRLIKLSSSRKQFVAINVDTGKKSKLNISDLLPL